MNSIIEAFARHRIAPNAVMFIVIFLGLVGLNRINTQYLPDFDLSLIIVSTPWEGASTEDVQEGLAIPIESAILALKDVDRVSTTSIEGRASMTVTLKDTAGSVNQMITEIEKSISALQLPDGVGDSEVDVLSIPDPIADVLIYGDLSYDELAQIADRAEQSLKAAGISEIEMTGLPSQRIVAEVNIETLLSLDSDIPTLAQQLSSRNATSPAGISGENSIASQLRFNDKKTSVEDISRQAVRVNEKPIPLSQIATLSTQYDGSESKIFFKDQPAVRFSLSRGAGEDTLVAADTLANWKVNFAKSLPNGVEIHVYNEAYDFVKSRIKIIVDNGIGGLLIVLVVLFIFLNHRLAWWVAIGVPVSFLATFIFLEITDNSINVISLLGFLIALGVIVDDAIVVGENAYANMENGDDAETAAIKAAQKMLPAVFASSVTTVAAFLPLLLVGGVAGAFAKGVPIVIIMAILASLIECFIILPGHLAHSFKKGKINQPNRYRELFEIKFNWFREAVVRKIVTHAVNYRATTFSLVILLLVLSITLLTSGRVKFVFFPAIQAPELQVNVEFSEGTPVETVEAYLINLESTLIDLENDADRPFINTVLRETNKGSKEQGGLYIQFETDRSGSVGNEVIIESLEQQVTKPENLISLAFLEGEQGPSNNGISLRLVNEDISQLLAASQFVQAELTKLNSLTKIADDLPLGSEQLNLSLTPDALALGLTSAELASRLRTLVDATLVQSLQSDGEEFSLTFRVNEEQTDSWFLISQMPISLGNGDSRPLSSLAQPSSNRSISQLGRVNGQLSAQITANKLNKSVNINEINQIIDTDIRARLNTRFPNVDLLLEGDQASQSDFFADVKVGGMLGLLLIFIALAWVFDSWVWPFAVMSAIPFALTGAIAGHWFLGLELSVLSIYGIFGLSGIIINDSIVLVSFYRDLRKKGMAIKDAVIEASVQRFRAVLLTTLTTVGGLSPLLFESSFDAQFLIPLAAVIAFGLLYGIVLILLFVPAMLVSIENATAMFDKEKLPTVNPEVHTNA